MTAKAKKNVKPMMAVALLAILVIGYFTRDKWMSLFTTGKLASSNGGSTTSSKNNSSSTSTGIKKDLVLQMGDKNDSVKELQRLLNLEYDYQKQHGTTPPTEPKLALDGAFGPKTEAMLILFTGKKTITINQLIKQLADQKN
ncbi:peptidoglycan-binding protein [Aureispira sp. CCB-QB1]|uniref:peptidoglycan-binding domain-containing protein n=1 Tax=Aureispira sp. CCB-QB1 TaxID=1313421 RepID=UPI000696EB7B|nr:hypothetical protein [Aureispira sp. CCB-QB1]